METHKTKTLNVTPDKLGYILTDELGFSRYISKISLGIIRLNTTVRSGD